MSTGKILLGVLAGAAAGAAIGILLAPDKGSVTREKLARKGKDYADDLEDKFNEMLSNLKERFEEAEEEITDLTEKARNMGRETEGEGEGAPGM